MKGVVNLDEFVEMWWDEARKASFKKQVSAVRQLHQKFYDQADNRHRCRGCIAGYDPATGALLHCAWPCPTIQVLEGDYHMSTDHEQELTEAIEAERDHYRDVINHILEVARGYLDANGGVPPAAIFAAVYVSEPELVQEDVLRGTEIERHLKANREDHDA